ncbi:nitrite reductase [NAD(P)H] [Thalassobacillus devorans]|uniref:Nitrite reductase [NAD(P)H] n=1 Tax=Thalassobacillus devorans TaxID=279813 RepID=A0ABQ1NQY9_9BACI|nr:nitrite reductase large subunit NirB [Thalassobacillus devorans]NIK28826.1 nitrite reductase (NADH) large subunit [Thalassobacillus devorans]GGC83250.1 nitrite reductase [NAD(P)H] [Thalassobacillus devorans]
MEKQKLILIGNGMAGVHCIQQILTENSEKYEITIFGSEPHVNYSRIMLSSVLQGGTSFEDIELHSRSWYEKNGIRLFTGETVTAIDKEKKQVATDQNRKVDYDKLIIATGSKPFILPLPGADQQGVLAFRTMEDCRQMIEASQSYHKAVVIGGGLLGLEAARGLLNLGMEVDVVHLSDYLMDRQLDSEASVMLQKDLEKQGMNFLLKKSSQEILGNGHVTGIRFDDGSSVEADLVVMAVGVRPNIDLAKETGIETNRGILVDDRMTTTEQDIYAVGECAEHDGSVYGLVEPLYEQGKVLAKHLCNHPTPGYHGSVLSTQLKISGVDVFSAGDFKEDDTTKTVHYRNDMEGIYKKIVFRKNKAIGAVLYGDVKDGPKLRDAIIKQKVLSDRDKTRLLDTAGSDDTFLAELSPDAEICTCNHVSKGDIIHAVQKESLTTCEEVKTCTKASSSCGGCKPLVSDLLTYIHSAQFEEEAISMSLCTCTTLAEDEVVNAIQRDHLKGVQEVIKTLNWKTKTGCSICRSAIAYHLDVTSTDGSCQKQASDTDNSERELVQADGEYAIIPQTYGGVLNPRQLRKLADLADTYPHARFALSSDQRIHIHGMKREEWNKARVLLDMPVLQLGTHRVGTVQTSVNSYGCSCDKSRAIQLAAVLDEQTERLKIPAPTKIAVFHCVHAKAADDARDINIVRAERGWELYVGEKNGASIRSINLLCVVTTVEEAGEMVMALMQYYLQSANYLEKVSFWLSRVGLYHIREVLFDEELRGYLLGNNNLGGLNKKQLIYS